MPTIKDLHCAMGEFLTASSEVENWMLSFVTTCQRDRASDEVFVDFMGKTLGKKSPNSSECAKPTSSPRDSAQSWMGPMPS
jgi:hypothetical protein